MVKTCFELNKKKGIESKKKKKKMEAKLKKRFYQLMSNALYGKTMENVRNRTDTKPVSNKKGYLKGTSKPNYMFELY